MNVAANSGNSLTSMDMCASKPGCGSASADLIPPALALQGTVNIHFSKVRDQVPSER